MNKVRVLTNEGNTMTAHIVDATEIGSAEGALNLVKDDKIVATFARGTWTSAAFVLVIAGGLPS